MLYLNSKPAEHSDMDLLPLHSNSVIGYLQQGIFRGQLSPLASLGVLTLALGLQSASAQTRTQESEPNRQEIEEIVIVDTRLDSNTFGVGESISVDGEELEIMQPADAEQIFQRLPGFTVSRPGGAGGVSEIFLRGAESNFTAVYVDGVRLNNSSNTRGGSFDSSMIDLFGIEQIDVATGAMSAIYGADAMAGVIRIRSAWAAPGTSTAFAEAGSANDWRVGLGTSLRAGNNAEWNLRASATDGGDDIEGSFLRNESFGTRLAGTWSDQGSWEVSVRHVDRERTGFPEVSGGPEFAVLRDLETAQGDELSISAAGNWIFSDRWTSDLYLSNTRIRDDAFTPAVAPGVLDAQPAFAAITEYERAQLLWVNRISLADDLSLVTGLDSVREKGSDNGFVDFGIILPNAYKMDRSINAAFAELGKDWGNGFISTAAVRLDDDGDDRRASGKLGVEKQVSDQGSRVWARVANGFKLPSFFALGNPLYGNRDLVEEQVRNVEFGYTHVVSNGAEFIVSAYDSRFEDLVDFDFENFTNINRGKFDVRGMEVRANIPLSSELRLIADGNFTDISSSAGPLRRRPERTGGLALDWTPSGRWAVNASARYVGPRLITSIPTGDVTEPGVTVLGATASYIPTAGQRYWIAIDNALDADYQDAPGFPSPGARLRIGTKIDF